MLFITIFERHTRQKKNTKLEFEMKGCVILPMKLLRIYEFMGVKNNWDHVEIYSLRADVVVADPGSFVSASVSR